MDYYNLTHDEVVGEALRKMATANLKVRRNFENMSTSGS